MYRRLRGFRRRPYPALVAVAIVLAACTPATETPATTSTRLDTSTAPSTAAASTSTTVPLRPYGGTVTIGVAVEPAALNAYFPGAAESSVFRIGQAYWVGVQEIDGTTLELVPELVTELPSVDNGGVVLHADGTMTVTYDIRPEAVWADGTQITGRDFEFTYQAIMDGSAPVDTSVYEDIVPESIVAEEKRFAFTLRNQTILYRLLFGLVLPRHDVAGSDLVADWTDRMWVSGGPFVLDEWEQGAYLRLVRNDRYWQTDPETGQSLPYLDEVVFRFLEADELVPALLAGDVDVIALEPTPEVLAALADADDVVVDIRPGTAWEHLNFQFGERRFERNPESMTDVEAFRKAVFHAIDRDRIVTELLPERATAVDSYVNVYVPGLSSEPWQQYEYDPDEARRLLDEVCVDLGRDCAAEPLEVIFTTTADNPARSRIAEEIGIMFSAIGLSFRAEFEEPAVFLGDTLPLGRWDLAQWAYRATPGDVGLVSIHDVVDPDGAPPFGRNLYRIGTDPVAGAGLYDQGASSLRNAATDRLAELRDLMNATVAPLDIAALALEAEQILADEAVFLPLFVWRELGAARTSIGGYHFNPTDAADTWNIGHWYRAGG